MSFQYYLVGAPFHLQTSVLSVPSMLVVHSSISSAAHIHCAHQKLPSRSRQCCDNACRTDRQATALHIGLTAQTQCHDRVPMTSTENVRHSQEQSPRGRSSNLNSAEADQQSQRQAHKGTAANSTALAMTTVGGDDRPGAARPTQMIPTASHSPPVMAA